MTHQAKFHVKFIIQQHTDTQSVWCGWYHFCDFCCFRCASFSMLPLTSV